VTDQTEDLSRYRLDRAFETFDDAKLLAGSQRWKSCVNRLYYTCFYAASALLARDDRSSRTFSVRWLKRHGLGTLILTLP
jgi:uncharacterized protein (UPF0332 family)